MKPEDQKRLEREADIARAVRGPDYSQLETSILRNKAVASEAKHIQAEKNQKFDMLAAKQKAFLESAYVPRFINQTRSSPTRD